MGNQKVRSVLKVIHDIAERLHEELLDPQVKKQIAEACQSQGIQVLPTNGCHLCRYPLNETLTE